MRELCTIGPLRQSLQLLPKTPRDRYLFLQMVHIKQRFQGLAWHVTSTDTSVFSFFSRPSMYNQTITGSALAIILKTFLPQGRVTVWRWVQITLLCCLETFDNLQKRKIVFLWTEDRILNRWPKSKKFVYRCNG